MICVKHFALNSMINVRLTFGIKVEDDDVYTKSTYHISDG